MLPVLKKTNKANITFLDVLTHQARLQPWEPFYKKTLDSLGFPSEKFYRSSFSEDFPIQVSEKLFLKKNYNDTIINTIAKSDLLPKKEAAIRRKELEKLRKYLDGVKTMPAIPDVVIIIDQKRELTAIRECRKLGIPVVSILDTNCDPDLVDIPIPGNDDAVRSIKLILRTLSDSINTGQSN